MVTNSDPFDGLRNLQGTALGDKMIAMVGDPA